MATSVSDIEEFLAGPLVSWLRTCVAQPESLHDYEAYFNGSPFYEVLLQIDPELSNPVPSNLSTVDTATRIKLFYSIIKYVKSIYEDELGKIVISLPNCVILGKGSNTKTSLHHMKLLILLTLGCAVQGPTKEQFITKIKNLDIDVQHDIVQCIKQVTDDHNFVMTQEWGMLNTEWLYSTVQVLISERDKIMQEWMEEYEFEKSVEDKTYHEIESNHMAVELADWKLKLRKHKHELEEKTEQLTECREELEHARALLSKIKTENYELIMEARKAKAYRDEFDALRDKSESADRLEIEVQRLRDRLTDADFYKVRVDELREDNRVLLETKEMLETQLLTSRQRSDHVVELEKELMSFKLTINEVILERDVAQIKMQELVEENRKLHELTKSAFKNSNVAEITDKENVTQPNLAEQLTNYAQARAIELELENKKLSSTIEQGCSENFSRISQLEMDIKDLTSKCNQMQQKNKRILEENIELECVLKNSLQDNNKLKDNLENIKIQFERQNHEIKGEKNKLSDLESTIGTLQSDNNLLQTIADSAKKKIQDFEKQIESLKSKIEELQTLCENVQQSEQVYREQKYSLEKENNALHKEMSRLRETMETQNSDLYKHFEEIEQCNKRITVLTKENNDLLKQLKSLRQFEQKAQELDIKEAIHSETLAILQKDLILEKINHEQVKHCMEMLGLDSNSLDQDITVMLEQILKNLDLYSNTSKKSNNENWVCKLCLNSSDNNLKDSNEDKCKVQHAFTNQNTCSNTNLQMENATLQVDVSTIKSQLQALQIQQTALQIANSQLVSDKEDLTKINQVLKDQHDTLLSDQVKLRTICDQLNLEYEEWKKEKDLLKKNNRDLRLESRTWKEKSDNLDNMVKFLKQETYDLENDSRNLSNLRAEHSKLKEDFRTLFSASERLKEEYAVAEDELKTLRSESRNLRLEQTGLQGELNSRSDLIAGYIIENVRLQQKCKMLYEMNENLDFDRRALMDHMSQLLSNYNALLMHNEEFQHSKEVMEDEFNYLCKKQKELEAKILQYYVRLDNRASKKRGLETDDAKKNKEELIAHGSYKPFIDGVSDKDSTQSLNLVPNDCNSFHDRLEERNSKCGILHSNPTPSDLLEESLPEESNSEYSLGSVGSRQTLYISEEETSNAIAATPSSAQFMVYNKITNISDSQFNNCSPRRTSLKDNNDERIKVPNSKDSAVWYEYGCV